MAVSSSGVARLSAACAIPRRRHHDGKASQASPWYRRSSAPRNPGAPPRLQCQQAPSLRWPPPPKSPSISMAPSPGGGHPRTPPTKRSQVNCASAAPRQLRWRLGRRQPRRTTSEIVCSGRVLAAGHATTSATTSLYLSSAPRACLAPTGPIGHAPRVLLPFLVLPAPPAAAAPPSPARHGGVATSRATVSRTGGGQNGQDQQ